MNGAQLHLLLNHLGPVGALAGLILAVAGVLLRKEDLRRAGLWAFVLSAAASAGAYLTGEGAEEVLKALPGFDRAAVHAHEEAAETAMALVGALGVWSGATLWRARSGPVSRTGLAIAVSGGALAAAALAWAAHLGGLVRHVELVR